MTNGEKYLKDGVDVAKMAETQTLLRAISSRYKKYMRKLLRSCWNDNHLLHYGRNYNFSADNRLNNIIKADN